jgi:hypothetical protein
MFRARTAGVLAGVAVVVSIAGAAVAIAASSYTPKLGSPNGKHVAPNGFDLTAKIADAKTVYIWVNKKHKIKKGQLVECTKPTQGCAVDTMKPWKGHKNEWIYEPPKYPFSGYFADTPGKYYWEIQSFAKSPPCNIGPDGPCYFYSKVGSFTVR